MRIFEQLEDDQSAWRNAYTCDAWNTTSTCDISYFGGFAIKSPGDKNFDGL
jgi:hypothetical protein